MYEERLSKPQNIILENCKHLVLSGVNEVLSFDEEALSLDTELGRLEIRGNGLHIISFDTALGDMIVDGLIFALVYTKATKPQSFIKRVFK